MSKTTLRYEIPITQISVDTPSNPQHLLIKVGNSTIMLDIDDELKSAMKTAPLTPHLMLEVSYEPPPLVLPKLPRRRPKPKAGGEANNTTKEKILPPLVASKY